jgi:hypothetical protein
MKSDTKAPPDAPLKQRHRAIAEGQLMTRIRQHSDRPWGKERIACQMRRDGHAEHLQGCSRGPKRRVRMRYKVGAEQLQQVPSLVHRPDGVFRAARTAPVGPTHAVCAATGTAICGINAEGLEILDQDWEAACFVEKCPSCFTAVLARGGG